MLLRPEWSVAGASGARVAVRSLVDSCRRNCNADESPTVDTPDLHWPIWARLADVRPTTPVVSAPPSWVSTLLNLVTAPAESLADRALLLVIAAMDPESPSDEAALALAGALSASDRRTVLLDLETPAARLSVRLDLFGAPGMADLLTGATMFDSAIHRLRGSRLHVIPAGRSTALPDERQVATVFDALAETYDAVVLHVGASDEPHSASWPGAALALVMRPASASNE